jgi:hypothetical protein
MFSATGCDSTPQSRLETAKYAVEQGEKQSKSLDAIIAELDASIASWKAILSSPDLPVEERDKFLSLIATAEEKLVSTKALKEKVDGLIVKSKDILTRALAGEDVGESEWQAYAELVAAIGASVGGKWGVYGALAATIIGLVISVLKQLNLKKEAKNVVASIDTLLSSNAVIKDKVVIDGKEVTIEKPVINKDEAKKILSAEQDTSTCNFVRQMKMA